MFLIYTHLMLMLIVNCAMIEICKKYKLPVDDGAQGRNGQYREQSAANTKHGCQ